MQTRNTQNTSCFCLRTRKASAVITKFYDNMLSPCGVTVRQYSLLLNISRTESCSVRELADLTDLDRSTLARSLKPLYHLGLIKDNKEPGGRNSQLELTESGAETLAHAKQLWEQAQEAVEEKLGEDGQFSFEKVLVLLGAL